MSQHEDLTRTVATGSGSTGGRSLRGAPGKRTRTQALAGAARGRSAGASPASAPATRASSAPADDPFNVHNTGRTLPLLGAPVVAAFASVPVAEAAHLTTKLINVTGEPHAIASVEESDPTAPGEFFVISRLPAVAPWSHVELSIGFNPQGQGPRSTTFYFRDAKGAVVGSVAATGVGAPAFLGRRPPAMAAEADATEATDATEDGPLVSYPDPPIVAEDACVLETDAVDEAAPTGIHLYLTFDRDVIALADFIYPSNTVGPGVVGAYRFLPHAREQRLLFFTAYHQERMQHEWVIGPASISTFLAMQPVYEGAATQAYPGSLWVPGSRADGADGRTPTVPSMAALEARGQAPYQLGQSAPIEAGPMVDVGRPPAKPEIPTGRGASGDLLPGEDLPEALEALVNPGDNAGGRLLSAYNAHIRIQDYVKPAQAIARDLLEELKANPEAHLEHRTAAVAQRNAVLDESRARLTPSARTASEKAKPTGYTVEQMEAKKTLDLLEIDDVDRLDAGLSEGEWARLRKAFKAAPEGGTGPVIDEALRKLGKSPEVSRAIIRSASRPDRWVTRLSRLGRAAGGITAAIGIADTIATITNADESRRWHVAAQELGGFAGGMIGAELGAFFVASLIATGGAAAPILVVTAIGAAVGGYVGNRIGRGEGMEMLADAGDFSAQVIGSVVQPAFPQAPAGGGFTGTYQREHAPETLDLAGEIIGELWQLDDKLPGIERAIAHAPSRDELEYLQRVRLDLLQRRDELGELLVAVRTGMVESEGAP